MTFEELKNACEEFNYAAIKFANKIENLDVEIETIGEQEDYLYTFGAGRILATPVIDEVTKKYHLNITII